MSQTTWWKGPVSPSMTGSEPNSCWYQGRLRSRSLTVSATWVIAGNSGITASVGEMCRENSRVDSRWPRRAPRCSDPGRIAHRDRYCSNRRMILPFAFSG